jgi:hypothetical protein
MVRKAAILLAIVLLAFTAACSSSSSSSAPPEGSGGTAAGVASSIGCPTQNTKSFAKTRFVADAALAGGAFKRYIFTPAREGKFAHGAHGRTLALVKAAAAGAFVINRLDAAKNAAEANPTLCRLIVAPLGNLKSSITRLISKSHSGNISGSDVTITNGQLEGFRDAATRAGAGFTDNTNASI